MAIKNNPLLVYSGNEDEQEKFLKDQAHSMYEKSQSTYQTNTNTINANAQKQIENMNAWLADQKNVLLNGYDTNRTFLENRKDQQQQNSSIMHDKMLKYLPTQVKAQGLGGLGVSETSLMKAYTDYNNNMSEIEKAYQDGVSELEAAYMSDKQSAETTARNAITGFETDRNTKLADAKNAFDNETFQISSDFNNNYANLLAEKGENAYATGLDVVKSIGYSNIDKLKELLNGITGLSEEQKQSLLALGQANLNYVSQDLNGALDMEALEAANNSLSTMWNQAIELGYNAQEAYALIEEAMGDFPVFEKSQKAKELTLNAFKEKANSLGGGGNISSNQGEENSSSEEDEKKQITGGKKAITDEKTGESYILQKGKPGWLPRNEKIGNILYHNKDFTKKLKERGFDDPKAEGIPNGTTITVKCDSLGMNEVNWRDIFGALDNVGAYIPLYAYHTLLANWLEFEERTVTYYDGQWYYSKKA